MPRRREIGYVCSRGHFDFIGDEEYGSCGSKKIATIYAEATHDDADMFEDPYEERDPETGRIWYSSSGYSEADYEESLDESQSHLIGQIACWRERG